MKLFKEFENLSNDSMKWICWSTH